MKISKFLLLTINSVLLAVAADAQVISKIEYKGSQRIEPETIESYIPIQVGDDIDESSINEALKSLNKTGFFQDVKIESKGSTLIVEVKENPIINKVSFEGNSKLSDKDIENALQLKPRETFSSAKVKEIQQGLLGTYRKMGRYSATVNPKIIKLKDNKVNVVFEINEGVSAGIGRIIFIGNNNISSSDLREIIYSKIKRWYRFFVTDDVYDQDRLQEDKVAIIKYYRDNGFLDAKVISGVAELSKDKRDFVLSFVVNEGIRYKLRNVIIKSHTNKVKESEIKETLQSHSGEIFNAGFIDVDCAMLTRNIGKKGLSAIKVSPEIRKDPKTQSVDVTFNITEGEKIYISRIIVKGNARTRDNVIRREIPLEEGDAFNQTLINMAEENLKGMGFFKSVRVETIEDPNSPDKCIVKFIVEEAPTGEAMISGSFSSQDGIGVDLSYSERNFLGTGKELSVFLASSKARTGKSYQTDSNGKETKVPRKSKFQILNNVNVSVTDPHIFDKDIAGTVSGYRYQSGKWDCFENKELGAGVQISYSLSSHITQSIGYDLASRKFEDCHENASPIIKDQVMKKSSADLKKISQTRHTDCNISAIKHTISYGTQIYKGLKGYFNTGLTTTFAGLGGSAKHFKNELFASYVVPFGRKSNIKFSGSAGLLSKIGGKTPHIIDSFSLGMETFRGFEDCGVGPVSVTIREFSQKDTALKSQHKFVDYIGASKYWKFTAEYTFPLGLPEELQFRGFCFSDIGSLWGTPNKGGKNLFVYDENGKTMDHAKGSKNEEIGIPQCSCPSDELDNNKVIAHRLEDKHRIRMSVGMGISFVTPFGPIKIAYAIPVKKHKYDTPFRLIFGFSTVI